ncbi:hypothetical protein JCM5353_004236 [Sporobolomyces roseus]
MHSNTPLLLAFTPLSTPTKKKPSILIIGNNALASLRTTTALEAGYEVILAGPSQPEQLLSPLSSTFVSIHSRAPSTSSVISTLPSNWDPELLRRLNAGQVTHVHFELPSDATTQEWTTWFEEVERNRRLRASFREEALHRRFLVNIAQHPSLSDFSFPVTRNHTSLTSTGVARTTQVAISSGSASNEHLRSGVNRSSLVEEFEGVWKAVERLSQAMETGGTTDGDLEKTPLLSPRHQEQVESPLDLSFIVDRLPSPDLHTLFSAHPLPNTCTLDVFSNTTSEKGRHRRFDSAPALSEKSFPVSTATSGKEDRHYSLDLVNHRGWKMDRRASVLTDHVKTWFSWRRTRRVRNGLFIVLFAVLAVLQIIVQVEKFTKSRRPVVPFTNSIALRPLRPVLKHNMPQPSFRANLRSDRGYITTYPYGGMTNQLVSIIKLVALGQKLDRVIIMDELQVSRSESRNAPLSEFFDVERWMNKTGTSIVNWWDLKDPRSGVVDQLTCWGYRNETRLRKYRIDTHTYRIPPSLSLHWEIEPSTSNAGIELLSIWNSTEWLASQARHQFLSHGLKAPSYPSTDVLCLENTFYVQPLDFKDGKVDQTYPIEEFHPHGETWLRVGQYLRFNPRVHTIVDELLISILGSSSKPFIAVHIRQGDFVWEKRVTDDVSEIREKYSVEVDQIQQELKERFHYKKDLPVLLATDAWNSSFVFELKQAGWKYLNHTAFETKARYGGWYPAMLDSAVLSRAEGFVGTRSSSFSYLAARRVETWNGGISAIVE